MARSVSAIQADLDAAYAGRIAIMSGAQSYSIDSGQSKKTVTRASLREINSTITALERELENASDDANGGAGIVSPSFRRNA